MKGMWKQSGLAAMACADAGQLSQAGRSRRRGRLVVYAFAVAFAALTAYIALCSPAAPAGAAGDGASWFDGVRLHGAVPLAGLDLLLLHLPYQLVRPSPEPSRPDGGGGQRIERGESRCG
ncbi:hypothetical protein ZWY2020_005830 [Hordeum vulgare]|nr:hypothetical protein ZWY2020_005830 [Hordeum vulgare]